MALSNRALRGGILTLIGVDLIALAAFSVHVDERTVTTSTPTAAVDAPVQPPAAVVPPVAPQTVAVTTPLTGGTPAGSTPLGQAIDVPASVTPVRPAPAPAPAPAAGPAPTKPSTSTPIGAGGEVAGSKAIPACPAKIAKNDASGGLQSLIPFAPAFGPFEPEAFAAASAYQPALQLLGPILAQYPTIEPQVGPAITPFLSAFGTLLDNGYKVVEPGYTPVRQQVLGQETKLAAALAPYSESLAYSKLGGCIVELENALVTDTVKGSSAKASTPSKAAVAARIDELIAQSKKDQSKK